MYTLEKILTDCEQCGKPVNILEYLTGHVCLECCKKKQREIAGKK